MTSVDPLLKNIYAVAELMRQTFHNLSLMERISHAITAAAGPAFAINAS